MPLPAYTTPYVEVAAPPRRPLRGGLLDALGPEAVHDVDRLGAQGMGVAYLSDTCNYPVGVFPAPCGGPTPPTITSVACGLEEADFRQTIPARGLFDLDITCSCGQHVSYGSPFTLWAGACTGMLESDDAARARARHILTVGASRGIERIFSTILPGLATDLTPAACAGGIVAAVAALEGQMAACYAGQGIIHAPAYAAPYLAAAQQFANPAAAQLETVLGTRFVLGGGYTGDGPASEVATDCTFWMYVTPQVDVWRGRLAVPYVQDTTHNSTMAVAEQPYAITVDCGGVYATRVNLDPCLTLCP